MCESTRVKPGHDSGGDVTQHSRGTKCPRLVSSFAPKSEGAGNAGARNAPAALRAMEESTQASHHRYAERSGIPCAMVYGLWRAPRGAAGVPGLIAPVTFAKRLAKLDLSVGRSGPHAFAVRLRAARPAAQKRPSHPALHVS